MDSSRLDVVEIARVPDMLSSFFRVETVSCYLQLVTYKPVLHTWIYGLKFYWQGLDLRLPPLIGEVSSLLESTGEFLDFFVLKMGFVKKLKHLRG